MALSYNLESNPASWKVVLRDRFGQPYPFWSWEATADRAALDAMDAYMWEHGHWASEVAATILLDR